MADGKARRNRSRTPNGAAPGLRAEDFRDCFGEELREVLNIDVWRVGHDLAQEYQRVEAEVRFAIEHETRAQRRFREEVLPKLQWSDGPKGAGHYPVERAELEDVQRNLLFNGGVVCCDGNSNVHDSLALTIYQIGVALVSYGGDQGTWCQRLFRHDLCQEHADPAEEALALLERRQHRAALEGDEPRDELSQLARRSIQSFAERAVLLRKAKGVWRMGHGSPAPYELFAASPDLVIESIKVVRALVEGKKFVFVASEPRERGLLTIGQALFPMEYAVVLRLSEMMERFFEGWSCGGEPTVDDTWDGQRLPVTEWVRRFRDEVAPRVVVGVYRATLLGPPHLFYAHEDDADVAARVALADSMLQEQRGFPLLIDLADRVCASVYGGGGLNDLAASAYAAAGAPYRYQSERPTRSR